ncbi:MAG TPA: HIRAN domain-containing protein [Burkholderiales bacterium]
MRARPAFCLLLAALLAAASPAHAQASARILVQSSPLAGFQYHEGKALWERMKIGDALTLVREPDNEHDTRAVRVEWQGHKLGYVPRKENEAVARQLDRGNKLEARIVQLRKHRDPWKRVEFEIFLKL